MIKIWIEEIFIRMLTIAVKMLSKLILKVRG